MEELLSNEQISVVPRRPGHWKLEIWGDMAVSVVQGGEQRGGCERAAARAREGRAGTRPKSWVRAMGAPRTGPGGWDSEGETTPSRP